jgi:hypothetical protein
MSDPIPGDTVSPAASISVTISFTSGSRGATAGLMHTIPAISGWRPASQAVRVPPIDSPATTTDRQRPARSSYAASAAPDQSAHVVVAMSSMVVP